MYDWHKSVKISLFGCLLNNNNIKKTVELLSSNNRQVQSVKLTVKLQNFQKTIIKYFEALDN